MIKLDYTLETPEERRQLVEQILQENPNPSDAYLETLADYLVPVWRNKKKRSVNY